MTANEGEGTRWIGCQQAAEIHGAAISAALERHGLRRPRLKVRGDPLVQTEAGTQDRNSSCSSGKVRVTLGWAGVAGKGS